MIKGRFMDENKKFLFCKKKYCFYFHIHQLDHKYALNLKFFGTKKISKLVDFSKFVPFKDFKCIVHTHTTYILGTLGVHATTSVTHRRDPAHLNLRQVIKQTNRQGGGPCPNQGGAREEKERLEQKRILNGTAYTLLASRVAHHA